MDKYDKAIEFFKQHPVEIETSWRVPGLTPHECLFEMLSDTMISFEAGCPLMIKNSAEKFAIANGKQEMQISFGIKADPGIPARVDLIRPEHLERFAYWQRQFDKHRESVKVEE
ncbi:MAG: hypothetical protein HKN40_00360 [Winogradskyella sp.]|uniref:hypothetical protein n=1 Tax=Winogradskyella sp. TaxID=1883156 RepID=UPI001816E44D|nr:hypothetical protein [Winogradskyella sp.]